MNLFFVICTVFGVTLLSCVTLLSVLGLDEKQAYFDEDWQAGNEERSEVIALEDRHATETKSRSASRLFRSLGAGIAFFGLAGCASHAVGMSDLHMFGLSALAGLVAFCGVGILTRQLPFDPFTQGLVVQDPEQLTDFVPNDLDVWDAGKQTAEPRQV